MPLPVAVYVSAADMPNEMSGTIELSVRTPSVGNMYVLWTQRKFSARITLKNGTATCKTLHCILSDSAEACSYMQTIEVTQKTISFACSVFIHAHLAMLHTFILSHKLDTLNVRTYA